VYHEVNIDPTGAMGLGAFASTQPTDPPPAVSTDEKERLRSAARKAEALYPGAVGRFIRTELESWANGSCFAFDQKGILAAAVNEILGTKLTDPPAAAALAA
jgi:hypothetical protein